MPKRSLFLLLLVFLAVVFYGESGLVGETHSEIDVQRNITLPMGSFAEEVIVRDGSWSFYSNRSAKVREVWDCKGLNTCNRSNITETYNVCEKTYARNKLELDPCKRTKNALDQVSIVADEHNHITAPMTKEKYIGPTESAKKLKADLQSKDILLENSWNIEVINRQSKIVSTLDGDIYKIENNSFEDAYHLEVYTEDKSGGLMGVVADPNFEENKYIYAMYSQVNGSEKGNVSNRISRFNLDGGGLDEKVLLDEIPGGGWHHGGRLRIGPENYIYASTGDAGKKSEVQKETFLGGKILRIDLDGGVPEHNPFENEVYAKGLRNPQGMIFHPEEEGLIISQHGPWRRDELRFVKEGGSYPWPEPCQRSDPRRLDRDQPLICTQTYSLAPSGMTVVKDKDHAWYGDVFVAGLRGNHVQRLAFDSQMNLKSNEVFYTPHKHEVPNRIRDVEMQGDGLWILGDSRGLTEIRPGS